MLIIDRLSGGGGLADGDSWSNWGPDPVRAFREHDPTVEPYASMSKEEILKCMWNARGGKEWEYLREFLLDKCTEDELYLDSFIGTLEAQMECGYEEFCLLSEMAGPATRLREKAARFTSAQGSNDIGPRLTCSAPALET